MEPSTKTKQLQRAWDLYRRRGAYDDAQLDEAVRELESHGIWSLRAMSKILDIPYNQIRDRATKAERTGGRFNPETLELMLEESRLADLGESNPQLTARIADMGTSWTFLAKVLGQSESKVLRRLRKGRGEDG